MSLLTTGKPNHEKSTNSLWFSRVWVVFYLITTLEDHIPLCLLLHHVFQAVPNVNPNSLSHLR
jgi:hypothetical protein